MDFISYGYWCLLLLSYVVYISLLLGSAYFSPLLLTYIQTSIQLFTSLYLIYSFNPLKKIKPLTDIQKIIIFNAGIYLLLSTAIGQVFVLYRDNFLKKLRYHSFF